MHQQIRVKALFEKMQSNTASLTEVQAITEVDPLVVRAALVNLQKEGVIYFTGKVYGLVDDECESTVQIFLERADEYVAKGIVEGFGETSQAIESCICGRKTELDSMKIQRIEEDLYLLATTKDGYWYWEKKSADDLFHCGISRDDVKGLVINTVYRAKLTLETLHAWQGG